MGDNIFHVICILERIICYENPPTDKTGGGGGGGRSASFKKNSSGTETLSMHLW